MTIEETPETRAEREAQEYLAQHFGTPAASNDGAVLAGTGLQQTPDERAKFLAAIDAENKKNEATPLSQLPSAAMSKAEEIIGGTMAGSGLRKIIPQDIQHNPEGFANDRQIVNEHQQLQGSRDEHFQQAHDAHAQAVAEHEANLARQAKAEEAHKYAMTLTPEEYAAKQGLKMPVSLTAQPQGGTATANYAMKFGATPEEANRVASMSDVQKQQIPAQSESWEKINRVAPGFGQFAESPLLLGPEGQKAVEQRHQQHHHHKTHVERAVAQHKAEAQIELENARAAAIESAKNLGKAKAMTQPSIAEIEAYLKGQTKHDEAYQRMLKQISPSGSYDPSRIAQTLSRVGRKVAPRFVPYAGAAMAPIEAEKAAEHFHKGNYGRAAVYGAGALGAAAQASNIPMLMGAGDIMQIPAAGLGVLEALKEAKNP
jgi:hypothetical protein